MQRRYLRRQGASAREIRRYQPILTAQIGAESNFTTGIGSPKGARDIAQFMPGTAPGYGVRLGDNRIKDDIRGQVRYMLPLLRQHGPEGALRGYNAGVGAIQRSHGFSETNKYVERVLGTKGRYQGLGSGGGGGGGGGRNGGDGGGGAQELLRALSGPSPAADLGGGSGGTLALLQALQGAQRAPQASSSALPVPAHLAGPVMPQGVQAPVSGGGPGPRVDTSALLDAIRTTGDVTPGPGAEVEAGLPPAIRPSAGGGGDGGGGGAPRLSGGGADRALGWAMSKLGFHETSENHGPLADRLNRRFGFSGAPWCAMFTSAAVTRGGAPSSARTASVAEVRRKAGAHEGYRGFVSAKNARSGDLILFGNSHIGMVRYVRNGRIHYIGGNQSDGVTLGSTSVGGGDIVRPMYGSRRRGR